MIRLCSISKDSAEVCNATSECDDIHVHGAAVSVAVTTMYTAAVALAPSVAKSTDHDGETLHTDRTIRRPSPNSGASGAIKIASTGRTCADAL